LGYRKSRNMIELAICWEPTPLPKHVGVVGEVDTPILSQRALCQTLDGIYDHMSLAMATNCYQLLEV